MSEQPGEYLFNNLRFVDHEFTDILLEGELVKDWEYEEVDAEGGWWTRVYYKLESYKDEEDRPPSIIHFIALDVVSSDLDMVSNQRVSPIVKGVGYFDGIRHIWWGDEGDGYLNYPNMEILGKVCMALHTLNLEYAGEWVSRKS